jgi:RNA polymerase sigma factor (sigma-70 family)
MEEAFQNQLRTLCRQVIPKRATSVPEFVKVEQNARSHQAQPFEEVFRLYDRRVYSICLRMTGNPAEAEDLTQEVFVLVFRELTSFHGESAFTTWLHRLTVNQVLMHFRKNYGTKEQLTEDGNAERIMFTETESTARRFSISSHWMKQLCNYRTAIAWSSSCTTWKGWNTAKSHPSWAARSEHPSRNCTEQG